MKNLFIIFVTYTKELVEIEKILTSHREYLKTGYVSGNLLASGPQNPRKGGIIVGQFDNKEAAVNFTKQDPFYLQNAAKYELVEFEPVLHQDFLKEFLA